MTLILDSSAAIEIVFDRPHSTQFTHLVATSQWIIAPDLFIAEVSNAFWKYNQFENLSSEICENNLELAISLIDDFIDSKTPYKEAFAFACQAKHSRYDILYLTLARRQNGTLLTTDKKLIKLAQKYMIQTIPIE